MELNNCRELHGRRFIQEFNFSVDGLDSLSLFEKKVSHERANYFAFSILILLSKKGVSLKVHAIITLRVVEK